MVSAFVPCAGFGTRLEELTKHLPKPLLEVGGRALVEHIARNLASIGIERMTINLHFMPEAIPKVLGDGAGLGIAIDYLHEQKLLGTAGTAKSLWKQGTAKGSLLVNYGDVITDMNLMKLIERHRRTNAWASILVHPRIGSNSEVTVDTEGLVTNFAERPSCQSSPNVETMVFSGICVLSPECLQEIPDTTPCDLPKDVFQNFAGSRKLMAIELEGYRCAIDSPARLRSAQQAWQQKVYRPQWRQEPAA